MKKTENNTVKKELLDHKIFNSVIHSENVSAKERWIGYLIGPFSVMLMSSILSNYLNVYYTDVTNVGKIWGGMFLSLFPIVVKILDAFTFIIMGMIVDRCRTCQGKARPWILFSAPLMVISMILLFAVPDNNSFVTAVWIFLSYNLFYSVAYTAYNTAHTLMVPLSTKDLKDRSTLSVIANAAGMITGAIIAVLFPSVVLPMIGVDRGKWVTVMAVIAIAAFPFILMEYYFTRERVTEEEYKNSSDKRTQNPTGKPSLIKQFKLCVKSKKWVVLMIYLCIIHTVNLLSSNAAFYYCNWVLGSYNDGYTQALYYALGNAPLGIGIFICRPVCKKLGRENAMAGGFILAAIGTIVCLLNPKNLAMVLIGQIIKSLGLIPSNYMITAMLGDALDDVEKVTGVRCDGFSSSVYNVIITLATGLALFILNLGLTQLGYAAPSVSGAIPIQSAGLQSFFIFCAIGCQTVFYPLAAVLLFLSKKKKPKINV